MKILFAVSNENIAEAIKREYQNNYKAQLLTKNVYYFNAVIKELQNNKSYDVVIISEDLEPFANNNYDTIDKFLIEKLKTIREEAKNSQGIPATIIFIATDRHILGDYLTSKLYEIGIYNGLSGIDRSIANVCTLMFHPRNKQEAKNYYRINAEIDNTPKADDVKEEEIKNIIAHYKKLGKAEERYVESFDNIASQYNDAQLKVIIRFLPLNVKAVLEAQSPKYQSLTTFANNYNKNTQNEQENLNKEKSNEIKERKANVDTKNDRVLEQISSVQNNSKVIIPNALNVNRVRKIKTEKLKNGDFQEPEMQILNRREEDKNPEKTDITSFPGFNGDDDLETINNDVLPGFDEDFVEESVIKNEELIVPKRGRGRPKKSPELQQPVVETVKKGRGRPKKSVEPILPYETSESKIENINSLIESFDEKLNDNNLLPEVEEEKEFDVLPGMEEEKDFDVLPGMEEEKDFDVLPGMEEKQKFEVLPNVEKENKFANSISDIQKKSIISGEKRYENIEYLIPQDKKIVSFIGTSKAGTSFMVNNLAHMLSSFNLNVAILDLTKNKNSFYIYTNNEEGLRNIATNSLNNLLEGNATGIKVNKNLTVYTSIPTNEEKFSEADKILKTLLDNHSIILMDCDYDTPIGYFDNSTDLFLIQNMDILTMQPLTAFLKELKAKNVLKDEKLRVVVNMETKVRGVNSQAIFNALSTYKDPGMEYIVDLYNKMSVKLFTVPFDIEAYSKYLTSIAECNISLNGYSKAIMISLKEICSCIYPLIASNTNKKNTGYMPPSLNNYSSPFNGNVDTTLNQMKNRF